MLRSQPPVYSPLPAGAIVASAFGRGSTRELSERIREELGADAVLLCGSGTQALQLALAAAARSGGGAVRVALPAFTCYDVASAAVGAGCEVSFYDIDPTTLTPDGVSLEQAVRGSDALVVAPLYGLQPDWQLIREVASRHGALLIEDAALSFGSRWRDREAGALGDLSVLSFGRGKGWTATRGGALLGSRQILEALGRTVATGRGSARLATLLRGLAQWGMGRPAAYRLALGIPGLGLGETRYHAPVPPRRLGGAQAALAVATLEPSRVEAERRRVNAAALREGLRSRAPALSLPQVGEGVAPGYLRLPALVPEGSALAADPRARALGIFASYPRALPTLPQLAGRDVTPGRAYPGASTLAARLVTLPTHSLLESSDIERILRLAEECVGAGPRAAGLEARRPAP